MKQILAILMALLLVLAIAPAVHADVIYVPEDPFLEEHFSECSRVDRVFRALTEVKVYESPVSDRLVRTVSEGDVMPILYEFTDSRGNRWGYAEWFTENTAGWLPLAYTEVVYDSISFQEDYGHTFQVEPGALGEEYAQSVVWFWDYPGSETGTEFNMKAWSGDWMPEYNTVYRDAQGRKWGFVGYYYGMRSFWICLDYPTAEFSGLYPEGAPVVAIPADKEPTLPAEEIRPQSDAGSSLLHAGITAAVVLCVGVTAGALIWMKKKNG